MEFFKDIIYYLAFASLVFSAGAAYLKVNKIWKRKHIRDVAESVSISGNLIDVIPLSIFALNYLFVSQWQGLIDSSIWIVTGIVFICIGTGFWVQGKSEKGLWKRLKEALLLEKKEMGDLAKALFKPSSAELVIDILKQIAFIDKVLDEREVEFIQSFANACGIRIDWDQFKQEASVVEQVSYETLHQSIKKYLEMSPSDEQVAQFGDVITALINVDNVVTKEEALALSEIQKLFANYIEKVSGLPCFSVIIIPQEPKQEKTVQTLLPNIQKQKLAGGLGYIVDSFFSKRYALAVCKQYQVLDLFTVVIPQEDIEGVQF